MLSNKNVDHENKKLNRDAQNLLKKENRESSDRGTWINIQCTNTKEGPWRKKEYFSALVRRIRLALNICDLLQEKGPSSFVFPTAF